MRPNPRSRFNPWADIKWAAKRRPVTYIAAFRCSDGIVLAADTLEVFGDQTQYAEKVCGENFPWGCLAVGGAGNGILSDAFMQLLMDELRQFAPSSGVSLEDKIRQTLTRFYAEDVTLQPAKQRQVQFLIAAHDGALHLWISKGRRLQRLRENYGVIGYDSPVYKHFARMLFKDDTPVTRGVVLSIYLLNLAKSTTNIVGGPENHVLTLTKSGVVVEDHEYLADIEEHLRKFNAALSEVLLVVNDASVPQRLFDLYLKKFEFEAVSLHKLLAISVAIRGAEGEKSQPNWLTSPYVRLAADFSITDDKGRTVSLEDGKLRLARSNRRKRQEEER